MAIYRLTKARDGSYTLQATLQMGNVVFHRGAVKGLAKSEIASAVASLAEDVGRARKKAGLAGVDGDKPGRTG